MGSERARKKTVVVTLRPKRERRRHSRWTYPEKGRPRVIINGNTFELIDISLKAVKFSLDPKTNFKPPSGFINATLLFHDGKSLDVRGQVIRIFMNTVVLQLFENIPSERVFRELQYLMEMTSKAR